MKKLLCVCIAFVMILSLMPCMPVFAYSTKVRFERVTSTDELSGYSNYIIVGCPGGYEKDEAVYYTMADYEYTSVELLSGYRCAMALTENEDGTLSVSNSENTPLTFKLVSDGGYKFVTDDSMYVNGVYCSGGTTYGYDAFSSKSLPLVNILANHISRWQIIFREDGTVLFKTSRNVGTVKETSGYIRIHHQANNGGLPVFSGGMINDSFIDLPEDESLTYSDLTEDNLPVKTYLYREVCEHGDEYLTYTAPKNSSCTEKGNIEYYFCSNCGSYLKSDKTTKIKLEDTTLPLAEHNLTYVAQKAPTCTETGNREYYLCNVCSGYFESDTVTEIQPSDVFLPTVSHSYTDGKCIYCNKAIEDAYFGYSNTGDGYRHIFVSEYDGKFYAMGEPNGNGMSAVEVASPMENVYYASDDQATFLAIEYGTPIKGSDGWNYTPQYIKIGENYLKNTEGTLSVTSIKDSATYWRYEYGYMYDDTLGGAYICLVTGDGEPYFATSCTMDDNHIKAYRYEEKCNHKTGLVHYDYVAPTCIKNGMKEYWYCNVCDLCYLDETGLSEVYNKDDLIILALGAKDDNGDDICDYCNKAMPIFTKVESEDEIVTGNKYIIVSERGGRYFAASPVPSEDEKGGKRDTTLLPAVEIAIQEDGTVKYKNADDNGAFMFTAEFAAECSDLDNGDFRYSLQGTLDGKVSSLADQEGVFFMGDAYAKYGYRLGLNEDKSASIVSVYSESWVDTDNGYLRMYNIDGTSGFSILEEAYYSGDGGAYAGCDIGESKVCLYRMTQTGKTVTEEGEVSYTINDKASTVDFTNFNAEIYSENAASVSNVSGMSEALTVESIDEVLTGYVEDWSTQNIVKMDVDVNISVTDYTEGGKESEGTSITFSLTPKMTVSDGVNAETVDISDSAFNKEKLMSVSLYVGSLYPEEIIHIKQDGTREYFYQDGHEKVECGEAQAFYLECSENGNWAHFSVTEFSDVIVNEYETKDTKTVTVIVDGKEIEVEGEIVLGIDTGKGEYYLPENVLGYYITDEKGTTKFVDAGLQTVTGGEVIETANINVTMVGGAQVRYGGGVDEKGKINSGNGLRFVATVDRSSVGNGEVIGYGMKITAEGSLKEAIAKADTWQDDETFSVAITDIAVNNYNRNYTAVPYVTVRYEDGTEKTIYSTQSVTRSIYHVAVGLMKTGSDMEKVKDYSLKGNDALYNVLNAYVNMVGIRLTLKSDGTFSPRTEGNGAYTGDVFFNVSSVDNNDGSYVVTITPITEEFNNSVRIMSYWDEFVRVNNNNSTVKANIEDVVYNEDGGVTFKLTVPAQKR
ncbi:MAG: hypothetical protein ACI3XA_09550 [Clostridia bacterium]